MFDIAMAKLGAANDNRKKFFSRFMQGCSSPITDLFNEFSSRYRFAGVLTDGKILGES